MSVFDDLLEDSRRCQKMAEENLKLVSSFRILTEEEVKALEKEEEEAAKKAEEEKEKAKEEAAATSVVEAPTEEASTILTGPAVPVEPEIPIVEQVNCSDIPDGGKKKVKPGLCFDNLIIRDEIERHPEFVIPTDTVGAPLIDNAEIINHYPQMGKIQDIVRNLGYDVEMVMLYGEFISNIVMVNGVQDPSKFFVVDYNGSIINSTPKIFLNQMNKYLDDCPVIHFGDMENLSNHLKGNPIIIRPQKIVTDVQRTIMKYVVNYNASKIKDAEKFEEIMINKVIPLIEKEFRSKIPNCPFAITNYKGPANWDLVSDKMIPYRFGELESGIGENIYIHANGYNADGTIKVTVK